MPRRHKSSPKMKMSLTPNSSIAAAASDRAAAALAATTSPGDRPPLAPGTPADAFPAAAQATTDLFLPPTMMGLSHHGSIIGTAIADSIRDLHQLHQQGLLTQEEFAQAKHQVLHDGTPSSRSKKTSKTSKSKNRKRASSSSSTSSSSSGTSSSKSTDSSNSGKKFMIPLRTNVWGAAAGHNNQAATESTAFRDQSVVPTEMAGMTNISVTSDSTLQDGADRTLSRLTPTDEASLLGLTARSPTEAGKKDLKRSVSTVDVGNKYGTFQEAQRKAAAAASNTVKNSLGVRRLSQRDVNVKYFNSRGRVGDTFASVQLHSGELKSPIIQHHCRDAPKHEEDTFRACASPKGSSRTPSRQRSADDISAEEKKMWDELSVQSSDSSSCLELNLNWYFVEVVGRDEHNGRKEYDKTLAKLTKEFGICPHFLVEREHMLVLPQILEHPDYPRQYMVCVRVATEKISTTDDSIIELTNRWLMIVDLNKKVIIVLHRLDCESMALLRLHWATIMKSNDIAFEEFLLKLLDDAVDTFTVSLDAHASLLDICEAKLLLTSKVESEVSKENNRGMFSIKGSPLNDPHSDINRHTFQKVFDHFDNSSRSTFLEHLLDTRRIRINKSEMNSFLYHLHRRASVQHRVLMTTQGVLQKVFLKLQLCSKEHARQMCSYCIELAAKAQEIRDDSQHLLDMHISLQSFRTNELMAVLTRLSVLFTPLAFLAGVYGMNFQNIPEYHFEFGYQYFWVVCILIAASIQIFFYKRGLF